MVSRMATGRPSATKVLGWLQLAANLLFARPTPGGPVHHIHKLLAITLLLAIGCTDDAAPDTNQDGADELVEGEGLFPTLPVLISPKVILHPPPELAAVQPTASLVFSFSSCAAREWTVERQVQTVLDGDRVVLRLSDPGFDCLGPTIEREYTVQISSDASPADRYVLLNPTQHMSASEAAE
jgi:hypothetical protein